MATAQARGSALAISAMFVAIIVAALGFAAGVAYLIVGIAEQNAINQTYVVGFAGPGDDCPRGEAFFDESNGESLDCVQRGFTAGGESELPGFTDKQNQTMVALASSLGVDGLSAAEQQEIQDLVDTYAASVPESKQPHYDEGVYFFGLYGTKLAVLSGVFVVLMVGMGAGSIWLTSRF